MFLLQLIQQEAQLSQRGRAMVRVVEYFAKSLKFIQNDALIRACVSVFHCNYISRTISDSEVFSIKKGDLEIWVRGHSVIIIEIAPCNRLHTSSFRHCIVTMALYHFSESEILVENCDFFSPCTFDTTIRIL